jgi:hypothetical protein
VDVATSLGNGCRGNGVVEFVVEPKHQRNPHVQGLLL